MIVRKHLFEKAIELLGLFTVDASIALHIGDWRLPLDLMIEVYECRMQMEVCQVRRKSKLFLFWVSKNA